MNVKTTKNTVICSLLGLSIASAGTSEPIPSEPTSDFERAIRPMTNLTQHDLAIPQTQIRAIYMNHTFPSQVTLASGARVPFGGDLNLIALQAEFKLNDRMSIVALKDGYIDFNPDNTFSHSEGIANIAGGIKYAFILDPENSTALSGIASVEIPVGDSDVFQGEGDGALNLILSGLKFYGDIQLSGAAGLHIPFSQSDSLTGFLSAHASYHYSEKFIPFVELNWYTTIDEGNGSNNFNGQLGQTVPQNVNFEGGDLINFGSANGSDQDLVTAAIGVQTQLADALTAGIAYEFPLTDSENSLYENRLTFTLNMKF